MWSFIPRKALLRTALLNELHICWQLVSVLLCAESPSQDI